MTSVAEIVAAYATGKTVAEVARQFHIHTMKVSRLLKEHQIVIRKPQRSGPERCPRQRHPWPHEPRYDDASPSRADAAWLGHTPIAAGEAYSHVGNAAQRCCEF